MPFQFPEGGLSLVCYECSRIDAQSVLEAVIACLRERRGEDGATMSKLTRQGGEILCSLANECKGM